MSEFSARPVRYTVPDRDYVPERPAFRRPGSDHSHIPHGSDVRIANETAMKTPAATSFDNVAPPDRRDLILAQLQDGPAGGLSRAELKDRLGCLDGATLDKTLWYMRERKMIERTDESCYRIPIAEDATPVVSGPAPLNADELRERYLDQVVPAPVSDTEPRIAITSDGSLLLWLDSDHKPVELRRSVTKKLYRVLHLNQELIA